MKAHELFAVLRDVPCDATVQLCATDDFNVSLTGCILDQDSKQITFEVDVEECEPHEIEPEEE